MIDWDNLTNEQVAVMCSYCSEIDYQWQNKTWYATRWCNAVGENICGKGDTALAAVINVEQKLASYNIYTK